MSRLQFPLHPAQREVYINQLLNMDSPQYNIGGYIVLKGDLNVEKFHETVGSLPFVFDAFKMSFDFKSPDFIYQLNTEINECELIEADFSTQADPGAEAKIWMQQAFSIPFDLAGGTTPYEHYLIKIADNEHWFLMKYHHLITDGYGVGVSVEYLAKKYRSLVAGEPFIFNAPFYQFETVRANEYYNSESYKKDGDYWKGKIAAKPEKLLSKRYPQYNNEGKTGTTFNIDISNNQKIQLEHVQLICNASLQQLTIAALIIYFGKITSLTDFVIGTPVHKRGARQQRGTVGIFTGALPFKGNYKEEQTLAGLLAEIISTQKQDYRHYNYLTEDLSRALKINPAVDSLYDVIVNYEPLNLDLNFGEAIEACLLRLANESERTPLQLCWRDYSEQQSLQLQIQFCYEYFTHKEIELLGERIFHIIIQLPEFLNKSVKSIDILPVREHDLLSVFSTSDQYINDDIARHVSIITAFEKQAAFSYGSDALVFEEEVLSYHELNARSNKIANYLKGLGVGKETLVAICIERSIEMITGILGILKAGGAYVPVDIDYPSERISYILNDTSAKIILSSKAGSTKLFNQNAMIVELDNEPLIEVQSSENLNAAIGSGQLAYVMYTSGSTGKPKGVMVEHGGVVNLAASQASALKLAPGMRTLQFASIGFDASSYEVFNTFLSGGCLVLCKKEVLLSAEEFKKLLNKQKIELAVVPPSFQQAIADSLGTVKTIVSAGEALNEVVGTYIQSQGVRLINAYGPTENTVCATLSDEPVRADKVITIGRPIANTQVYIRNQSGELSPIGVPGEICIGGVQVARGYLNQPELTKEKFINDPYSEEPNARLYRTGDQGRWLADGNIEYLGRIDDQVKIRGYRIELGEIEQVLLQNENVRQAVVLARADKQDTKRLTAYVVIEDAAYDKQELQNYLGERLPEYMVPRLWVRLDSLPLTPNGKTDKKALPEAETSHEESYTAPQTTTEKQLGKIWEELLGVEKIGTKDNFFELGGHSLLAMRVISQVRKELNKELTIRDLFVYPTIEGLAKQLEEETQIAGSIIKSVKPRPQYIPLSYSQERLWFIDRLEGSVQYHIPAVIKLTGEVNTSALENALKEVVERHEVLRTVIREHDGQGYQCIKANSWALKQSGANESETTLKDYISKEVRKPFDLSQDDMLRAELIRTGQNEYLLLLVLHHIAADGWSMPVLVSEFSKLYNSLSNNETTELKTPEIQYSDYAIWQRGDLDAAKLQSKLGYWHEKLAGTATLELPIDHMRPALQSSKGAIHEFMIGKEQSSKLQKLSIEQGATLYMTLLSIFKVLLYRYSGQEDICIGTPVANRDREETTKLIGFFVNTLALRTNLSGEEAFTELLSKVKQTTLEAYGNQEVPFEKVVEAVVTERDLSRSPLFQVMFVLQNAGTVLDLELGNIKATIERAGDTSSKYDLTYNAEETKDGIRFVVEYNTDLYEAATIARMAGHYAELIALVISKPATQINKLQLLSKAEEYELQQFNETAAAYPKEENIISLFEAQVKATPTAIALVFEEETISYQELNEQSNRVANYLKTQGVTKETLVAICTERGINMMAGILGILKAGAAYVPVDTDYPKERISYIIEDANAQIILSTSIKKIILEDVNVQVVELDNNQEIRSQSSENLNTSIGPNQLAYIMYTSGSTGKPKGVMVEHGNVISLVKNACYFEACHEDTLLVTGSPSFDATTFEYWSILLNGGKLILCSDKDLFNSNTLKKLILQHKVTVMWFTSSWFNQLADDAPEVLKGLNTVLVGGEKLSVPHIKKIRSIYPALKLINGYGPTENTTFSLTYPIAEIGSDGIIPVGRPLNNRKAYILGPAQQLNPVGVFGEVWVGGAGVSRGYLNQPELTSQKFIKNPFTDANELMYKTGDIGRWLSDGNIEYKGRTDDQVKIRGYRVELGEIENVLLQSGLVNQAVVIARPDNKGVNRLTGYIVADAALDKQKLQDYLHTQMPDYTVPRLWVQLESFPLTVNGKINKRALPEAELSAAQGFVAARNEIEKQLTAIWQELLGINPIGIYDNFFELGGHSVLAMRVVHYVEKELAIAMPISVLFQFASISELSKYITVRKNNKETNQASTSSFTIVDI
ncbi:amino acid adenylation domain-containing protein [Mucilaginibacter sp. SMC90]|uniref:non-ribosomal peptide synthetase n=1 Tax=Mucilaginibacter sp. SMC90 TaxID=2929803 RepID=UPI001FB25547|nr:non-ribosomal peptide synthetase [Mucilaginibacter sp. SMC90]UOE51896.1 amino acid adenylation domain-containing protein [Mucilaginibacter sp. SMC90]